LSAIWANNLMRHWALFGRTKHSTFINQVIKMVRLSAQVGPQERLTSTVSKNLLKCFFFYLSFMEKKKIKIQSLPTLNLNCLLKVTSKCIFIDKFVRVSDTSICIDHRLDRNTVYHITYILGFNHIFN